MKHDNQYYENGLPYMPLYDGIVEGFKKDTGFSVNPNTIIDKSLWVKPYVVVVSIPENSYAEILAKFGKLSLKNYVIAPDHSEFWLVFNGFYIRAAGITGDIKKALPKGNVQCIVASKSNPIVMPFQLKAIN